MRSAYHVLCLSFATATAIVLIAELLTNQVPGAGKNAENYNSHEKLFHLYLQENLLTIKTNRQGQFSQGMNIAKHRVIRIE